jgi:TonB family protein
MGRYFFQSALIHLSFFGLLFVIPWIHRDAPIIWIDNFDFMGDGGGGGGMGGGGPKPAQKGQVVPEPPKIRVPDKPAPIQKAQVGPDTWKIKEKISTKEETKKVVDEDVTERGDKTQEAKTNIIRRGVPNGVTDGNKYDYGEGAGGGAGIGIGFGPGMGGGFGFGSYLRIMRQRIWGEWTQSAVYGSKLACVVGLTVSINGDVSDVKVEQPSGNAFYDNVALRAVRNSSPLPPLPPNFPKATQRFNIQFRLQD